MRQYIFGTYLGCTFFAAVSLCGQQDNLIENGTFTKGGASWTSEGNVVFSRTGGVSGGRAELKYGPQNPPYIAQQIESFSPGNYELQYYIQKDGNSTDGILKIEWGEAISGSGQVWSLLEKVPVQDISQSIWDLGTINWNSNFKSVNGLRFTAEGLTSATTSLFLSDIKLFYLGNSEGSTEADKQNAALAANGLNNNINFAAVTIVTNIGSNVANGSLTKVTKKQTTQGATSAAADAAAEAIDAANAATDAANLAAEAADAATVAAEEARDAADAATAAVEELATQVATLIAALKAQITTLANTVAKIAKKVRTENILVLDSGREIVAGNLAFLPARIGSKTAAVKADLKNDKAVLETLLKSLKKMQKSFEKAATAIEIKENQMREKYKVIIGQSGNSDMALLQNSDEALIATFKIPVKDAPNNSCISPKYSFFMAANNFGMAWIKFNQMIAQSQAMIDDVENTIEQIDKILPMIHLVPDSELAMMDVLDEEHLVAAKGMDPTRQIIRGSETGASFNNTVNVWGRSLGQYMHQSKSRTSSAFSSGTGGALMGADWKVSKHKLGFAAAYMYTYMGQAHKSGHVNINQGGLAPYGSFIVADWKFDASIYGGYTHNNSHRNGLAGTVKYHTYSNSHAWQLAPHLQITYAGLKKNSWWTADPYVMGDYVANWQSSVTEKGSSAYNTKQKASFSGFIRTETGFSFSETIAIAYGQLILREKAGWAYQRSLSSSTSSVSVAGTTGAFVVPNNAFIQNLGVAEFAITFISPKKHVPNIEVSYEGQFGSKFISQLGAINLSKDF